MASEFTVNPDKECHKDLMIDAAWIIDTQRAEKPGECWLYILPRPTLEEVRACDQWLTNPNVAFLAYCFENNVRGDPVFILFMVLLTRRTYGCMRKLFPFNRGLLTPKRPRVPSYREICCWMRGPYVGTKIMKVENTSYREMRREGYGMGGRAKEQKFINCVNTWVETFVPYLDDEGDEVERMTKVVESQIPSINVVQPPILSFDIPKLMSGAKSSAVSSEK
jgi:hypothetical protein